MPLTFHPSPGTIVICDFSTGFRPPEMVKVRPVVVISPRRRTGQLATVVPLSSTAPLPIEPRHYCLRPGTYPPARGPIWVKGDMVATVGLVRLDRVRIKSPVVRSPIRHSSSTRLSWRPSWLAYEPVSVWVEARPLGA